MKANYFSILPAILFLSGCVDLNTHYKSKDLLSEKISYEDKNLSNPLLSNNLNPIFLPGTIEGIALGEDISEIDTKNILSKSIEEINGKKLLGLTINAPSVSKLKVDICGDNKICYIGYFISVQLGDAYAQYKYNPMLQDTKMYMGYMQSYQFLKKNQLDQETGFMQSVIHDDNFNYINIYTIEKQYTPDFSQNFGFFTVFNLKEMYEHPYINAQ